MRRECQRLHPGYEFKLWTDKSARDMIAADYPKFLDMYDGYGYGIQVAFSNFRCKFLQQQGFSCYVASAMRFSCGVGWMLAHDSILLGVHPCLAVHQHMESGMMSTHCHAPQIRTACSSVAPLALQSASLSTG